MFFDALLPFATSFVLIIGTMRGIETFENHVSRG